MLLHPLPLVSGFSWVSDQLCPRTLCILILGLPHNAQKSSPDRKKVESRRCWHGPAVQDWTATGHLPGLPPLPQLGLESHAITGINNAMILRPRDSQEEQTLDHKALSSVSPSVKWRDWSRCSLAERKINAFQPFPLQAGHGEGWQSKAELQPFSGWSGGCGGE